MLVIGGVNFAEVYTSSERLQQDVFSQGLGVFDMSNLTWAESYEPGAANYTTPQIVKQYINSA